MGRERVSLADCAVLVTGGCGFVGSHLVRRLLAEGARRVVVLDRLSDGRAPELPPGAELVRFNLGVDPPEALAGHLAGIDVLFHLAADKHGRVPAPPLRLLQSNVTGTFALLEAAATAGVRKAVFSSSLYAYGRSTPPPLDESETPRPSTVYGISKLAGEHLLAHIERERGLPGVSLRYFFVYGPGQGSERGYRSVIPRTLERLARGENAVVYGDGEQTLDYVYVDDVVEATLLAAELDVSGEVLNVGSGLPLTVNRLMDAMLAASGARVGRDRLPPDATAGSFRVAAVEKTRRVLGWQAQVTLEDGLARTWDSLRSERTR
jgi:UDP-glucose 4-epimerase